MNVADLLSDLHELGVELAVDGDRLRYSAPKGVLSEHLLTELAAHKSEILAFLRKSRPV